MRNYWRPFAQSTSTLGRLSTALRTRWSDAVQALLQRDVGHLAGRSVDLVERAIGERVNLDGVEIAAARRLDARGGVRQIDPLALIAGLLKEARSTHAILRERVVSGL